MTYVISKADAKKIESKLSEWEMPEYATDLTKETAEKPLDAFNFATKHCETISTYLNAREWEMDYDYGLSDEEMNLYKVEKESFKFIYETIENITGACPNNDHIVVEK